MLRASLGSLAPLLAACAAAPAPAPGAEQPPAEALFDGRTLAGWEGDARFWRVEEGAIVGESSTANPCRETTYLVWRGGEAGDFELELEWRFPGQMAGANSGVQFRSRASAPGVVAGYQADLETGPDWTGGLYEQDGRGVVTRRGERVVLDASGAKAVERFADGAELLARVAPGAWNRLRVTAFGPRLSLEVNGVLFSETIDLDAARAARRGQLALQLHAGPAMRVEYRGLRLRSLEPPAGRSALEGGAAARPTPRWIWPAGGVSDDQTVWFRRRFELARAPVRAELWISADNHFDAWLDGQGVATSDDWTRPVRADVTSWVQKGENELLVRARNDSSAAGLVLQLTLELEGGARSVLGSDESFEACPEPPQGVAEAALGAWLDAQAPWRPAQDFGALGVAPWGVLGEGVSASGTAPEAETIQVPPGFTVERLYSVPLAAQGSWVSLTVDARGRFYASDQYGGLFRISAPPAGARDEALVEPLALDLGEAHGLLWAFDALYAVVSAGGEFASGLYRARDTDGDDQLDRVECLRAFDGDGEHGPHGVVAHPDGRSLVIVGGNHTALPGPFARSRLPVGWGEDVLLPPLDDPGGHAVGIAAPGGWVVRTDPEGEEWELVAAGFRNAYDLAFDAEGELFTYDSDMEWDVGLPWYRPTRVCHVVAGAEFGWRSGSRKWPADSFDSLPAAVELGLGSPTGIVFGSAAAFPAPWNQALFVCDWAYGRIFAVFLEPHGASRRGRHEVFASGQPFPVTDAVVGADGALYVIIGGRQTQSGLYRIAWGGGAPPAVPVAPTSASAGESLALRRQLEELQLASASAAIPAALAALGHPDRFVRYAARIALEHQEPALWAQSVLGEREPRRALEGLLALVRSAPATDAHEVVERALGLFAAARERSERLDATRLLELVLIRLDARDGERARIQSALDGAYPSGDARLDRALLGLLVAVGADVSARALAELERATAQEERIAILYALRALDVHGTDAPAREANGQLLLAAFERELASARGGASVRGYLEKMRDEARARLGWSAEALVAATARPATLPASVARHPSHAWTLAELEPRLGEIGRGRDFARGRAAYRAASCQQCHRLAGEGENLGPDLTGAAGRYSARDLLLAILEPSREVPDVWRDVELWGGDRLLAVGRLEAERAGELVVLETSGASVRLDATLVTERVPHRLSRMAEGLLDMLAGDEVLDLLAYVLAGGDAEDERFR